MDFDYTSVVKSLNKKYKGKASFKVKDEIIYGKIGKKVIVVRTGWSSLRQSHYAIIEDVRYYSYNDVTKYIDSIIKEDSNQ